jgi:hypothetical protein
MNTRTKIEHSTIDAQIVKVARLIEDLERERAVLAKMMAAGETEVPQPTKTKAPKPTAKPKAPKAKAKRATKPAQKTARAAPKPKRHRRAPKVHTEPVAPVDVLAPAPPNTAPAPRVIEWQGSQPISKAGVLSVLLGPGDPDKAFGQMIAAHWLDPHDLAAMVGALADEGEQSAIDFQSAIMRAAA